MTDIHGDGLTSEHGRYGSLEVVSDVMPHDPAMSADQLYDVLHAASPTDQVLVRTPGGGVWVPTRVYRTEQGTFVIMCAEDMTDNEARNA